MLLESGADVDAKRGDCGTALIVASSAGYEQIVRMLLESGADVNAEGSGTGSASSEGYEQIVHMLLENGANVDARGGQYGSALVAASFLGYEQIVQLLLNSGADINFVGFMGSALDVACINGNERIVQMQLDNRASVNMTDNGKATANWNMTDCNFSRGLSFACFQGNRQIVKMLLESKANIGTAINRRTQIVVCGSQPQLVQTSLDSTAGVNTFIADNGDTALCLACSSGYEPGCDVITREWSRCQRRESQRGSDCCL